MSRLDEIKARIEEDRDTSEHCIDIDHADWLVSEIERLRGELATEKEANAFCWRRSEAKAADYIRSEAERLPNGTAAKFIAALDAMDGATDQKGRGAEVSGLSEGEGCREGGES